MNIKGPSVDRERINSIVQNRLLFVSSELKQVFPAVLRQEHVLWATICEPEYLMLVFLTNEDKIRIDNSRSKRINPYLGLVTTGKEGAAFRIEKSKYMTISSCRVENSYALSLGPDSTILLIDHQQSIKTKDMGPISYTISLAYILSYGEEINDTTLYDYLDGLIAFSENIWRNPGARK